MSLPNFPLIMRCVDNCPVEENRNYMRFLYEACARGIEGAGHLTSTDRKLHTEPYGPIGKDVFVTEYDPPDLTNMQFLRMLLKINKSEISIDQTIDELSKKIKVAVFKVKIAKQHLEKGEGYPHRLVALPLDKRYDPWAQDLVDWFHDKGDHVAFDLSRQDNWDLITHKYRIFDGLFYTIKKYRYSTVTGVVKEDKSCLAHPRLFKGHGIRHVRTDMLIKYRKFDGFDLGALVGWSMGSSSKVSQAPAQASNYAEIREAWPRYIHKLCVPFDYGALQA